MKKSAFLYWFPFLLLMLALTSCRTTKPTIITETITEKITETLHDTVFQTEKDSSQYRALLDCINGKVVTKVVTKAQPGKNLNAPKVKIENNELTVDCEARAQELFASWKSKETLKDRSSEKPVYIEHQLTFWEELQIWVGRILFILFVVPLVIWLIIKTIRRFSV